MSIDLTFMQQLRNNRQVLIPGTFYQKINFIACFSKDKNVFFSEFMLFSVKGTKEKGLKNQNLTDKHSLLNEVLVPVSGFL